MSIAVIDIAADPTPDLQALWSDGVRTIFGYLSSINPTGAKCWTPVRVKAAAAVGFRIGLVHEGWGGVDGRGISAVDGNRDGRFCRIQAANLGAPRDACVYFACDQDFTQNQINANVLPYFRAIQQTTFGDGYYRTGVYGSGLVCSSVKTAGYADLTWEAQSRGWMSYNAWLAKADMVQEAETMLTGLDADTAQADIGDYVPVWSSNPTA